MAVIQLNAKKLEPPTITGAKQSEIVRSLKHLLDLARTGRVSAIGFAVIQVEDDEVVSGTNAVWCDDHEIKTALGGAIDALRKRVAAQGGILLS